MNKNLSLMEMIVVLFINNIIDYEEKDDFLNRVEYKIARELAEEKKDDKS